LSIRSATPRRPRSRPARFAAACLAALLLAACGEGAPREAALEAPPPPPAPAWRGLWVLCEGSQRVLEDPARLDQLVERAVAMRVTDVFVQVYRGGKAWYDSSLADASPYRAIREATGTDTLARLLERAHAAGLRVHAWVNVLSLHTNADAPILRDLGAAAVQVDRRGRSLLDYPQLEVPPPDDGWYRMGTRGIYLDPAAPGVAERLAATFAELVARYPALDGLHLDYIRHPDVLPFVPGSRFGVGLDFGYGKASLLRFQRETGLAPPSHGAVPHPERWDAWRRDTLTALVARIRSAVHEARPRLFLSAAVIPHADRAYLSLYQDWRRWLDDGLLDFAVAMTYTLDDRLLRYELEGFAGSPRSPRIWAGLGVWLFASHPERALAQLEIARRAGAAGEALFSYDSIADAPALLEALSQEGTGAG
jgi:uncharacterized lipoprotein YddW (UPF0748 family)